MLVKPKKMNPTNPLTIILYINVININRLSAKVIRYLFF